VIPLNTEIENPFSNDTYEHGSLVKEIDTLSKTKLSVELRAELITQLAKTISSNTKELFSLLINESDDIISKEDLAFTPVVRSGEEFKIPKSVKVDFMKSELYDLLISKFENGFDKKEPKSRELQRSIKAKSSFEIMSSDSFIKSEKSSLVLEEIVFASCVMSSARSSTLNFVLERVSISFTKEPCS
jgi:hypothetical protein